jgi:hypothetical protein
VGRSIYKVAHDSDPQNNLANTAINYEVIKLLADLVVRFITKVIGRTIVLKEQEVRLKEHTKIWKLLRSWCIHSLP